MLDAGHYGNHNAGAVSGYFESNMAWELQGYLKSELESYGFDVGLVRLDKNTDMDVYYRGKAAKGYDLLISLHSNAISGSPYTKRVCVFVPKSGKATEIGNRLADSIITTMDLKDDGLWYKQVKSKTYVSGGYTYDYYGVIRGAAAVGVPGIILEHSFHTNPEACAWLMNSDNLKKLAQAEAKTLADHYGLTKIAVDAEDKDEFIPYHVEVTYSDLRIRKGPGTNYEKNGYVSPGTHIIVAESDGIGATKWGQLESGEGWISLDYVTKTDVPVTVYRCVVGEFFDIADAEDIRDKLIASGYKTEIIKKK